MSLLDDTDESIVEFTMCNVSITDQVIVCTPIEIYLPSILID